MLDYSARESELGKTIGDDFREGKITLPVVLAFAPGRRARAPVLAPHARASWTSSDGDLEHAIELMNRHGTLAATLARAAEYAREARRALALSAPAPEQQALDEVDRFLPRARLLRRLQRLRAGREGGYIARRPECSSAW